MKIRILAYTTQGGKTGERLIEGLEQMGYSCEGYLFHKYYNPALSSFVDSESLLQKGFEEKDCLIFICAAGIAVRKISPFVHSKVTDSAVVVVDDLGQFVIPLLSGHLGGANEMAGTCAAILGATPVITTATDLHGKFAVDLFAKRNQLVIEDMKKAKLVSAALLEEAVVYVCVEEGILSQADGSLPQGIQWVDSLEKAGEGWKILVSLYQKEDRDDVLQLIPRAVTLGIGCRKGTPEDTIAEVVEEVLARYQIDKRCVSRICSIDVKKEEKGLLCFAQSLDLPFVTFSSQQLAKIPGEFTKSAFVLETVGVDSVCERSAVAGSGGRLLIRKQAKNGVTVAAAVSQVTVAL